MAEQEAYVSKYQAPEHTIVDCRIEGTQKVTTVVLDGELAVFELNLVPILKDRHTEGE